MSWNDAKTKYQPRIACERIRLAVSGRASFAGDRRLPRGGSGGGWGGSALT